MNLRYVIEQMTWSYSRIRCFEDCPYKFFLTYIKCYPEERQFFASFGSFVHAILAYFLNGEIRKDELVQYYILNFRKEVEGKAPSDKVFEGYFNGGYDYLKNCPLTPENTVAVELPVNFELNGHNFVGFVDYIRQEYGALILGDHKSRALKPRSNRKKPTQGDRELDKYYEQLYLYCKPVYELYGKFPDFLEFNCFRSGTVITEPFDKDKYDTVLLKFGEQPDKIADNESWHPSLEFFKCRYLCDKNAVCEYYQTNKGV